MLEILTSLDKHIYSFRQKTIGGPISGEVIKRGTFATLASGALVASIQLENPTPAEAQGQICRASIRFESSEFIDMFPVAGQGRRGKRDEIDPITGAAVNFQQEVLYSNNVVATTQIVSQGNVGRGEVTLNNLTCNGVGPDGKPAIKVQVRTSDNREDVEEKIIPNGQRLVMYPGRELKDKQAIIAFARTMPDSDPRKKQILDYYTQVLTPTISPTIRATVILTPTSTATFTPTLNVENRINVVQNTIVDIQTSDKNQQGRINALETSVASQHIFQGSIISNSENLSRTLNGRVNDAEGRANLAIGLGSLLGLVGVVLGGLVFWRSRRIPEIVNRLNNHEKLIANLTSDFTDHNGSSNPHN